jgi:ATP-dependent helicase/nuclease subunit B
LPVSNFKYDNSKRKIKTNLFFRKPTFGVSEVESFMLCPFIHYMNYGLKLKEKDLGELDQMNVGTIMHSVAEIFSSQNKLPIEDNKVESEALRIFDKAISEDVYEGIVNNISNKIQIENLKKEAVRFCFAMNDQAKHTAFKTILSEAFFDDKNEIKGLNIKIGNKTIKLVGAVDRIDTFKDYFRIIDYKTGKCDISFAELYYGKKIQLYVYQNVVGNSLKLKPAGAYYFPVKNTFNDEENTNNYKLKGYTVLDEEVIYASDDNLITEQSSDIIYVKKNKPAKDGSVCFSSYSKLLKQQDMLNLGEYAIAILNKACADILGGEISPSPLSLDGNIFCDKCKYKSICRYDDSFKNRPRVNNYKIDIDTFKRGHDGE